ncbi:putative adenylyltransferase/sulfurtransferase MoeZ [bacterium HR39]|nr:putative adenylyltransferase/sulfurtransferase MoeZ [bacterium HR39]
MLGRLLQRMLGLDVPAVDVEEADGLRREERALFLDVREAAERRAGTIPGSRHVPLGRLLAAPDPGALAGLPKEGRVVVFCATGARSAVAVRALRRSGHAGAVNLRGGLAAWTRAGKPLARG